MIAAFFSRLIFVLATANIRPVADTLRRHCSSVLRELGATVVTAQLEQAARSWPEYVVARGPWLVPCVIDRQRAPFGLWNALAYSSVTSLAGGV